jgi:ribosomal protein S18 acetylase RimI-like enzyme
MDVTIVPCSPHEVDALRKIAYETYDRTFRPMNTAQAMEKYLAEAFSRERLLQELLNPESDFSFLYADDVLCGYLKLNEAPAQSDLHDPESLEIERIYVTEESHGKGLGKALINHAVDVGRKRAKRYLWLGVWERNLKAIAFYKKVGFTITGHHFFRMGDDIQRDFIMQRMLVERSDD